MGLGIGRREERIIQTDTRKPGHTVGKLDLQVAVLTPALAGDEVSLTRGVQMLVKGRDAVRDAVSSTARRLL